MGQSEGYDAEMPLVEAIRAGDRYAFSELMARQDRWVRGVIYSVLGDGGKVDDVAQQVWTSVWQRIGELREIHQWRCWLYRLTRNAAIDAGREVSRRRAVSSHVLQSQRRAKLSETEPAPDHRLANLEEHREVVAAIEALPALYREPFVLRHVTGWSYRRIAEVMGMPVDTVETRLVRARRLLRQALKGVLTTGCVHE